MILRPCSSFCPASSRFTRVSLHRLYRGSSSGLVLQKRSNGLVLSQVVSKVQIPLLQYKPPVKSSSLRNKPQYTRLRVLLSRTNSSYQGLELSPEPTPQFPGSCYPVTNPSFKCYNLSTLHQFPRFKVLLFLKIPSFQGLEFSSASKQCLKFPEFKVPHSKTITSFDPGFRVLFSETIPSLHGLSSSLQNKPKFPGFRDLHSKTIPSFDPGFRAIFSRTIPYSFQG